MSRYRTADGPGIPSTTFRSGRTPSLADALEFVVWGTVAALLGILGHAARVQAGASVGARPPPGTVWAWGANDWAQLGDGTTADRCAPVRVWALTGVAEVAPDLARTCGGVLWAWGRGRSTRHAEPSVLTRTGTKVVAIGAGFGYVALRKDGTVLTWPPIRWGRGTYWTGVYEHAPKEVHGIRAIGVAGGKSHFLAIAEDGTVWAWGDNDFVQLGDGTDDSRVRPVQVKRLTGVTSVAAGYYHSLALHRDGTVWEWGGRWGSRPDRVKGLRHVVEIAAGYYHSLAVTRDGVVWWWGWAEWWKRPDWQMELPGEPIRLEDLRDVKAVAGGGRHSLALKSDGTVWAWGRNNRGQLGDGTTEDRLVPVQVKGLTGVVAISAGFEHSLAVKE